jgi:hypothetical protein
VGYSLVTSMRTLLACPFCREMFEPGETPTCPACGLALKRLDELPKGKVVGGELEEEIPPDEETLPWTYWGRGRGALLAVAVLGILAFFLPWVHETAPERVDLSGPQIASHLGWMWAPLVAWLVMIPLVASRRSIFRMRGARVAVAFLAGMSLVTVVVRMAFKPAVNKLDPHILHWGIGMYVTAGLSAVAIALALGFGGRIDSLTSAKQRRTGGETLH